MKEVESYFFLPKGSICSIKKGKAVVEARSIAVVLCKKHTRFSWQELADIFEKDHSSLFYYNRIVRENPQLENICAKINTTLLDKYI
jgi:chromosomal replication initiation ATPase DnaA